MLFRSRYLIAAIVVAGITSTAMAEDVDNPLYTYWARYRPGSYVIMEGTTEFGALNGEAPIKVPQAVRYALIENKPDEVVVQVDTQAETNNRWQSYPSQKLIIPAKCPAKTDGLLSTDDGNRDLTRKLTSFKASTEKVGLANELAEAVVREYVVESSPGDVHTSMKSKEWYVDDVPGGLMKLESLTIGQFQMNTKMQVTEWNGALMPAAAAAQHPKPAQPSNMGNEPINGANLNLPYNNPNASTPGLGLGGGQGNTPTNGRGRNGNFGAINIGGTNTGANNNAPVGGFGPTQGTQPGGGGGGGGRGGRGGGGGGAGGGGGRGGRGGGGFGGGAGGRGGGGAGGGAAGGGAVDTGAVDTGTIDTTVDPNAGG